MSQAPARLTRSYAVADLSKPQSAPSRAIDTESHSPYVTAIVASASKADPSNHSVKAGQAVINAAAGAEGLETHKTSEVAAEDFSNDESHDTKSDSGDTDIDEGHAIDGGDAELHGAIVGYSITKVHRLLVSHLPFSQDCYLNS
jgi:hypothetical protein